MFTNALLIATVAAIKVRQDDPTSAPDIQIDFDQLDQYSLYVTDVHDGVTDTWYPMNDTLSLEDIVDFLQD